MTNMASYGNRVREFRANSGLTQAELARRVGISRTSVTAIESQRMVPSVTTALALAEVLGTRVETLFGPSDEEQRQSTWAVAPPSSPAQFWEAEIGGRRWRYPAESAPMLSLLPDGVMQAEQAPLASESSPAKQTLVMACCDPAAGLLASEFARQTGLRLLVLQRSGREAIDLLQQGKVHLAGVHLSTREEPARNADFVRETLGPGFQLLRIACWQEGIAAASTSRIRSVRGALRARVRWVGREPGSGARQCLDRLLGDRPGPRRLARNHRGVAEAVLSGWADAGVCVQLTSSEAGLVFLPVQEEAYELCLPNRLLEDPRGQALLRVVRSVTYRNLLGHLPGYDTADTGELAPISHCAETPKPPGFA